MTRPDLTRARSGREPTPIGEWVLHADLGVLRRGEQEQRLNAKALHVLLELIDANGAAVSRDDLLAAVWGDSYPTDAVVSRAVADLRSALGEAAGDQVYIKTVPKFGYQLLATEAAGLPSRPSRWMYAALPALLLLILWWAWHESPPNRSGQRLPSAAALTADPGLEHQPRFSADGAWVVYAALRPGRGDWDLFRVAVADGRPQAVAAFAGAHEHGPAISPDGDQVAYVRLSGPDCYVVTQSLVFGVPQSVADCTAKFPTLVDWSPDGSRLVYTVNENADPDGFRRLYELDLASGARTRLSDAVSPTGSDFYPRYSPSGEAVAFLRGEPQPDHRSSLWLIDTATGAETRITEQPAQLGGMTWIDADRLFYSIHDAGRLELRLLSIGTGRSQKIDGPDLAHPEYNTEKKLLVAAQMRSERDLAIIDAAGDVSAVASSTSDDHHGVLQPGGGVLAYISRRSGFDEIWLYDLAADTARQLTQFEGATIRYPAWHPDGLRLLFTVQGDAGERLFETDVVSGAIRQIGDPLVGATTPVWLADGSAAVFGCNSASQWNICMTQNGQVREIASGYFHPVAVDTGFLVVVDARGALHRLKIEDGSTKKIWDGMPGVGRYGWTVDGDKLFYIDPVAGSNTANIVRRELQSGAEELMYTGPMPFSDTTLSYDSATDRLLFTRYQAASDDLVIFDMSGVL